MKIVDRIVSPAKLRAARAALAEREGRPVTQGDVAAAVGVPRNDYALMERGDPRRLNCKIEKLARLASLYGCTVDALLDEVPVADPERLVV